VTALANPRHEAYAQHQARRPPQRAATRAAGYAKENGGYGSQLDNANKPDRSEPSATIGG
jgi:hypothetical protein